MIIEQKAVEVEATGKAINEVIHENEGWQVVQILLVPQDLRYVNTSPSVLILFQRVAI